MAPLMIQLTDTRTGLPVFLKPSSIDGYGPNHQHEGSVIRVDGVNYFVNEEPAVVNELIDSRSRAYHAEKLTAESA